MTAIQTKVCIVGAGPGGAATALRLSYLGIPCVLIDKATFPREKVCGDAISRKVITLLNRLDPLIMQRFNAQSFQLDVRGASFIAPNGRRLNIPFALEDHAENSMAPGYISRRLDFDHFLVQEVQRRDNVTFYPGVAVEAYERTDEGYRISGASGALQVEAPLLVVANGAHSTFSRKVAGLSKDPKHHAAAVRAYFRGVTGVIGGNYAELHYLKSLTPGYFWIFPLPNGLTNVGLGLRSDIVSRRKTNLRQCLQDIISQEPGLRERFANAEQVGPTQGYGLPLGSKIRVLSGDHYMLVGDAGHLVDPLTGEGIGNAFYSGFIAAEQAEKCLQQQNFSAVFLRDYDVRVQRVLGSEMKLSYRLQQMMHYPRLINFATGIIAGNHLLQQLLARVYADSHIRDKLVNPLFWLKMMMRG